MQLTDVICYIIRKGKEARRKLWSDWTEFQKLDPLMKYAEWKQDHGHKGQRFFDESYARLNGARGWLFSKDFPT